MNLLLTIYDDRLSKITLFPEVVSSDYKISFLLWLIICHHEIEAFSQTSQSNLQSIFSSIS